MPDGEPQIYPQPEQYKYLSSYLFLVSPVLLLSYQNSIRVYDIFQFLLLPLVGLLVYQLTKGKRLGDNGHSRSARLATPGRGTWLGILCELLLAVERGPIKSDRDSIAHSVILSRHEGQTCLVRRHTRNRVLRPKVRTCRNSIVPDIQRCQSFMQSRQYSPLSRCQISYYSTQDWESRFFK